MQLLEVGDTLINVEAIAYVERGERNFEGNEVVVVYFIGREDRLALPWANGGQALMEILRSSGKRIKVF